MLYAFEGKRCVLSSPISTGKDFRTPNGSYSVQDKQLIHYSTLFDNAPMPYSLHLHSNYFIHGFSEVPDTPASHGCIRVPETFARVLFDWVKVGTSVVVKGRWESLRAAVPISTNDTRRAVRVQPAATSDTMPSAATAQYVPNLRGQNP